MTMSSINSKYPLKNDLMIRAARGEHVEKTPIWLFRQAGRHLPEYNEYKKTKGKNFLELLDDPEDVAECTIQPVRRYNIDAAILFSDILVILQALGIPVAMPGGLGITVPSPLTSPSEVYSRLPKGVDVKKELKHVITSVALIKERLQGKVPLIGFSAAPFSLMFYMVGGSSKKNTDVANNWLDNHPNESKHLMDLLTGVIIDYTKAQIEAGADMIQIFEAMGEFISEANFYKWALPSMTAIAKELKAAYPHIPLLVFPRGATYSLSSLQQVGYDVVTLDTKTPRKSTRIALDAMHKSNPSSIGTRKSVASVQGNLDVALLKAGASTKENVHTAAKKLLEELGPQKLIANLGEGLTGQEDPELVASFIDSIHDISTTMIGNEMKT
jgi:uroporphyrinogen decarboxylase